MWQPRFLSAGEALSESSLGGMWTKQVQVLQGSLCGRWEGATVSQKSSLRDARHRTVSSDAQMEVAASENTVWCFLCKNRPGPELGRNCAAHPAVIAGHSRPRQLFSESQEKTARIVRASICNLLESMDEASTREVSFHIPWGNWPGQLRKRLKEEGPQRPSPASASPGPN